MNESVRALAVFDDGSGAALYAGGFFNNADGGYARHIAKWDGTSWSALVGELNGVVFALAVFDDGSGPALYAGGTFSTAGGETVNRIAKWDGTSWSALAGGMNSNVYALEVFDDGSGPALYAGGYFTTAGGETANRIAKWNGTSWSALGGGMNNHMRALAVFDDGSGPALYAGGDFSTAGGETANRIAKWDGSFWSAMGSGMSSSVYALTSVDDGPGTGLYAGGGFTTAGGQTVNRMAKWDGSAWSALRNGTNGNNVWALTVFDDGTATTLFAGGDFSEVSGTASHNLAQWDVVSQDWQAIFPAGLGLSSIAYSLTAFDDGSGPALYVGGSFSAAGGASANRIAKWDGTSWSALGSGMNSTVYALAVFDDGSGPALYAGGVFTTAGGATSPIAKWDGTSWSPLGSGMNSTVFALAVFDDGSGPALYAGGNFSTAGGESVNRIAKWNGTSWSALGEGLNSAVTALTVFDDGSGPALYAGGHFTTAGGEASNYIAKWDGTSWSAMGDGMDNLVLTLTVFDDGSGSELFAGGSFSTAGGETANRIAKWDGTSWSAMGSGMSSSVYALTSVDDGPGTGLYAGGYFTTAGGQTVNRIAKWDGTSWSAMGVGTNNAIRSLTSFDDGVSVSLYAGGSFTSAGGLASNKIAKWSPNGPDCNDNRVADECDLIQETSSDDDGNGVPDECDPCFVNDDCDDGVSCNGVETCDATSACQPGTPPCGSDEFCNEANDACVSFVDCNENGIHDSCDINCAFAGGACDVSGCGDSSDDDTNGTPDECQSAELSCGPLGQNGVSGGFVAVDIFVTHVTGLNGYQVQVEPVVSAGPGVLTLSECFVDQTRSDFVFTGLSIASACDSENLRLATVALDSQIVDVPLDTHAYVGTFVFEVSAGATGESNFEIVIQPEPGSTLRDEQETPIVFTLADPCEIEINECQPPSAVAEGSRYLQIELNPPASPVAQAIRINSPTCPGLVKYVDADGCLVDAPVFMTAEQWGTVHVAGDEIVPDFNYEVTALCDEDATEVGPTSATTWTWGDSNHDGGVDIVDIQKIIHCAEGTFNNGTTVYNTDLVTNCVDQACDVFDVTSVLDAFVGDPYPGSEPCEAPLAAPSGPGVAGELVAVVTLRTRRSNCTPDSTFEVEVFIQNASSLRAYQLQLSLVGETSGNLTCHEVFIDTGHTDYAFSGTSSWPFGNDDLCRLSASLTEGSVDVGDEPEYLGTFVLQSSSNADGVFPVVIDTSDLDSVLLDSLGGSIPFGADDTQLRIGAMIVPGDFDCDTDVDLLDYASFEWCRTHPGAPACEAADFDGDNVSDFHDWGRFQAVFTGVGGSP
jgi:Rax2 C-terminal beta propeller domain